MKKMQIYIHIPFCVKKCDYCDFLSGCYDERTQQEYVQALCQEIKFYGTKYSEYVISTIFIGGGTPSWLDEELMQMVMESVRASFHVEENAEITIECNPGTVSKEKFVTYHNLGINRISIGLQSANDDELKLLGRIHTYDRFLHTYELARECNFHNINVDVMTGLPGQNLEKLHHTLQQVIRLKPEHISAYALIIEPGTPFYEQYKFDDVKQHAGMNTEFLPNEDEEYQLYKMTQKTLQENGYRQYEISNYAKVGYHCKHNVGYWKRENYLGVGIGASSLIEETRYSNITDIYDYIHQVSQLSENPDVIRASMEPVERKGAMEEFMFLGLRMDEGITRAAFEAAFHIPIDGVYKEVIEKLREEGLLESQEGRIWLTEKGQDLSNYALAEFLFD